MKSWLLKISTFIDRMNRKIGESVSWLTLALVVLVCIDVMLRYLFSRSYAWLTELEWHLFALIFLLSAGYAVLLDKHVRVDLFYSKFTKKDQCLVDFAGGLLFLLPWSAVLIYFSFTYALDSYRLQESSNDPGGLPILYLIKFAVPLSLILLLLQGVSEIIKSGTQLFSTVVEKPT